MFIRSTRTGPVAFGDIEAVSQQRGLHRQPRVSCRFWAKLQENWMSVDFSVHVIFPSRHSAYKGTARIKTQIARYGFTQLVRQGTIARLRRVIAGENARTSLNVRTPQRGNHPQRDQAPKAAPKSNKLEAAAAIAHEIHLYVHLTYFSHAP